MNYRDASSSVDLSPARTGRPRSKHHGFVKGERVLVSARLPAELAALVYESADRSRRPISTVVAEILAEALQEKKESTT